MDEYGFDILPVFVESKLMRSASFLRVCSKVSKTRTAEIVNPSKPLLSSWPRSFSQSHNHQQIYHQVAFSKLKMFLLLSIFCILSLSFCLSVFKSYISYIVHVRNSPALKVVEGKFYDFRTHPSRQGFTKLASRSIDMKALFPTTKRYGFQTEGA
jgi:hypothetical protein